PQLTFNGGLPYHPGGVNFSYNTELVRFERDLENGNYTDEYGVTTPRLDNNVQGLARANGTRLNLVPAMSLPMTSSYGFVTPSLKYAYTQYDLDLDGRGKTQMVTAGDKFD
ncbi:LPS assembly protein LptD, partial [Pseudomonas sp. FSL R10-0071]